MKRKKNEEEKEIERSDKVGHRKFDLDFETLTVVRLCYKSVQSAKEIEGKQEKGRMNLFFTKKRE